MDNINIYEADGTLWATIKVSADCYYRNALEGDESVELRWEAYDYAKIPVGSYVNIEGRVFRLTEPHEPTRRTESIYTFAPVFYSQTYHWKKAMACLYEYSTAVTYTDTDNTISATIPEPTSRELDWSFTGNLPDALFMLIQMIKNETGVVWNAHYVTEIADKLIEFTSQGSSIYEFLTKIAELCGKEFYFDYTNATPVVNIGTLEIEAQGTHTSEGRVLLNVGEDVTNPSVQSEAEEYFTRFYFFGSTRNIVQPNSITKSSVVNRRLPLCPSRVTTSGYTDMNYYPKGFIDINRTAESYTDREYIPTLPPYKVFAKSVFFDDIYPRSDLKIQSVQTRHIAVIDDAGAETGEQMPKYFVKLVNKNGSAFNFNSGTYPNGDMLPTLVPSISFRSGLLQGLEYELIYHATDFTVSTTGTEGQGGWVTIQAPCFEIVFDTNSNPRLPNDNIKPQANDECTLFNIHMPQEYIWNAQKELEQKAIDYIDELNVDKSTYDLNSNPIAFDSVSALGNLQVGSLVKMVYPNGETIKSRVISIEKHLDIPCDCKIILGYSARQGTIQTLRQVIEDTSANVESVVKTGYKTKAQLLGLKNGYIAQKETFDAAFDADGYFDGTRIKPLTIETQALKVGSRSQQFALSGIDFSVAKYTSGAGVLSWDCNNGKLSHFTIDETCILQWNIGNGSQNLATYGTTTESQYIYAKVAKDGFPASPTGGIKVNSNTGTFLVTPEQKKFDSDNTNYYFLVGTVSSELTESGSSYKTRIISLTYGTTTINGKQITTGVIKSSDGSGVIIDLDNNTITGKIKFLSGGQAVDAEQFISDSVDDAVSEIEIGGRNYLRNSATMKVENSGKAAWRASGGTLSNVAIVNKPISPLTGAVRCTNSSSSVGSGGMAQYYTNDTDRFKFKVGEKYTQSYYIRGHLSFYDSLPSSVSPSACTYVYDEASDTYTLTSTVNGQVNVQVYLVGAFREVNYLYLGGKEVTISVDINFTNSNNKPRLYIYDSNGTNLLTWNLRQGHNETTYTFPSVASGHTIGLILRMNQYDTSGNAVAVGDVCTFKNLIIKQANTYNYPQPIWQTGSTIPTTDRPKVYITHEWQRVAWGGELDGTQADTYSAGYTYCTNMPVGGWFEVCAMKLEDGSVATDWSPAPEDTEALIDGIEVGGRNLLPCLDFWEQGTTTDESNPNKTYEQLKHSSTTRIRTKTNINLDTNSEYTINNGASSYNYGYVKLNNGYGAGWSGWLTGKHTFKPSGFNSIAFLVCKSDESTIVPSEIVNVKIKLEKGNKATDWTPAPEDVDAEIQRQREEIENGTKYLTDAMQAARQGEGEIEGGLILGTFIGVRKNGQLQAALNGGAPDSEPIIQSGMAEVSGMPRGTFRVYADGHIQIHKSEKDFVSFERNEIHFYAPNSNNVAEDRNVITTDSIGNIGSAKDAATGGGSSSQTATISVTTSTETIGENYGSQIMYNSGSANGSFVLRGTSVRAARSGGITTSKAANLTITAFSFAVRSADNSVRPTIHHNEGDANFTSVSDHVWCAVGLYRSGSLVQSLYNADLGALGASKTVSIPQTTVNGAPAGTYTIDIYLQYRQETAQVLFTAGSTGHIAVDTGALSFTRSYKITSSSSATSGFSTTLSFSFIAYKDVIYKDGIFMSSMNSKWFGVDSNAASKTYGLIAANCSATDRPLMHLAAGSSTTSATTRFTANGWLQRIGVFNETSARFHKLNMIVLAFDLWYADGVWKTSVKYPYNGSVSTTTLSTGCVRITHNLGHSQYFVLGSGFIDKSTITSSEGCYVTMYNRQANSVDLRLANDSNPDNSEAYIVFFDFRTFSI